MNGFTEFTFTIKDEFLQVVGSLEMHSSCKAAPHALAFSWPSLSVTGARVTHPIEAHVA